MKSTVPSASSCAASAAESPRQSNAALEEFVGDLIAVVRGWLVARRGHAGVVVHERDGDVTELHAGLVYRYSPP